MHHTYRNIVWHLNIDSARFTLQSYIQFFLQKALISIWMLSLPTRHWLCIITSWTSLQHIWTAPTNTWYHYLLSCFQARIVVIMEKERCHGCDKWFAWIEQHLTYHNHCQSVMVEHACQQRLIVECRNRNNGMDPLIGTIVVVSTPEVDDGMSDRNYTAMRTHVRWSVHLSALLITWFTWEDGLQRRYASDVAFCIICFSLTDDNSDMN
jgi:hypothetical protein